MTSPEPSPNCEEGKHLFEAWKKHPITRLQDAANSNRTGPAWRDFTRHMASCPLCDRRSNTRGGQPTETQTS